MRSSLVLADARAFSGRVEAAPPPGRSLTTVGAATGRAGWPRRGAAAARQAQHRHRQPADQARVPDACAAHLAGFRPGSPRRPTTLTWTLSRRRLARNTRPADPVRPGRRDPRRHSPARRALKASHTRIRTASAACGTSVTDVRSAVTAADSALLGSLLGSGPTRAHASGRRGWWAR